MGRDSSTPPTVARAETACDRSPTSPRRVDPSGDVGDHPAALRRGVGRPRRAAREDAHELHRPVEVRAGRRAEQLADVAVELQPHRRRGLGRARGRRAVGEGDPVDARRAVAAGRHPQGRHRVLREAHPPPLAVGRPDAEQALVVVRDVRVGLDLLRDRPTNRLRRLAGLGLAFRPPRPARLPLRRQPQRLGKRFNAARHLRHDLAGHAISLPPLGQSSREPPHPSGGVGIGARQVIVGHSGFRWEHRRPPPPPRPPPRIVPRRPPLERSGPRDRSRRLWDVPRNVGATSRPPRDTSRTTREAFRPTRETSRLLRDASRPNWDASRKVRDASLAVWDASRRALRIAAVSRRATTVPDRM